jgi:DNA-binding response OmpR family regulator
MMYRVLVIEDEPSMQTGLRDNLEIDGYTVTVAGDGKEGLDTLLAEPFDLVLLDVMLPSMSGFDILKHVRARGIQVPVIMLTARGEEIDKVLGLELGADDYITKPFSLRELLARVKAVLRRGQGAGAPDQGAVAIGEITIDFATYTAQRGNVPVEMTAKECEVLKHLWEHRNQTVSRDQLLTEVWGYDDSLSTRTVDNFILRLRQKVESDPAHPRTIVTIHGAGYKLIQAPHGHTGLDS